MAGVNRTPLIAGNWKMNLDHLQAVAFVQKLHWTLKDAKHEDGTVEVALFPPFTDLRTVQTLVEGDKLDIKYGAQDLSPQDSGAYTGDISGAFLAKLGCAYVTVGHSERREGHGETDDRVIPTDDLEVAALDRTRVQPRIAYMPQGLGKNLYPTLSVFENIDFFGRLFGHGHAERERRPGSSPGDRRTGGPAGGGRSAGRARCRTPCAR